MWSCIFTCRIFIRSFCPKRLTVFHTYIHTLMAVAAMEGANQHIRSSLEFSNLTKDTSTCKPGESNQRPSNNKTLALTLSHRRPGALHLVVNNICLTLLQASVGDAYINWLCCYLKLPYAVRNMDSWQLCCHKSSSDKHYLRQSGRVKKNSNVYHHGSMNHG